MEKYSVKVSGKISYDHTIEIAANSHNSLAGGSRGEWQTAARVNLGPEFCQAVLVAIQKFLEIRCCLRKCFEKNLQLFLGGHHWWQLSDTYS